MNVIDNVKLNISEHDQLLFEKNKKNISQINYILVDEFQIFNSRYILRGLIVQPFAGHYATFLKNVKEDSLLIKKGNNFYYYDTINNNEIICFENWRTLIKNYIPYIALYEKS